VLIALRNLARHKVKTVLTVLAITVSSAFYIFVDSWIEGMSIESRRNIVNYEMGAAKIQTKLYFEKKEELPSYENFANWKIYKETLDKAGYYAAPRFVFSGTLYSEGASAPVTFNAVDPIAESQVLRYTSYVENGRYIKSGAVELVVGTVVAKKLNLLDSSGNNNVQISAMIDIKAVPEKIRMDKWEGELMPALKNEEKELLQSAYQWEEFMDAYLLKEEVELDSTKLSNILETMIRTDFSGAVKHINQLIPAIVVGVVNSPNPVTNFNIAYIPMDVLQGEQGMMLENRVTEILIRDKNANDAELPGKRESATAIAAVLDIPAELGVFTWMDYSKDYIGYEKMESTATKILTLLLFILALLGISNTILMSILERTKEIGMMRALGMTDNQLVLVYMLEAGFLGLLGSIFGIIFGCAMNYPMVKYGVDFSSMRDAMGANASFRISSLFRSSWNVPVIIGTGIIATLVSSLMAFFPARRAVKMPITDSLRFE